LFFFFHKKTAPKTLGPFWSKIGRVPFFPPPPPHPPPPPFPAPPPHPPPSLSPPFLLPPYLPSWALNGFRPRRKGRPKTESSPREFLVVGATEIPTPLHSAIKNQNGKRGRLFPLFGFFLGRAVPLVCPFPPHGSNWAGSRWCAPVVRRSLCRSARFLLQPGQKNKTKKKKHKTPLPDWFPFPPEGGPLFFSVSPSRRLGRN